jgi:hypothetical protein
VWLKARDECRVFGRREAELQRGEYGRGITREQRGYV